MAKHVGEKWKVLNPEVREEYEYQAASAKEKYGQEMVEYKKTENFREYDQYLKDFKARTNKEPSSTGKHTAIVSGIFMCFCLFLTLILSLMAIHRCRNDPQ